MTSTRCYILAILPSPEKNKFLHAVHFRISCHCVYAVSLLEFVSKCDISNCDTDKKKSCLL